MEKLAAYVVREGGLSTDDAVGWIIRLTATLEPIHGLGVSHGRVSAKAIQIAGAKCTNEGFLLDASDLTDDPAYFSQERLMNQRRTPADDTWAVGVTLYQMLTGELPYRGTSIEQMKKLVAGPPPSPLAVFDVGDDTIQRILDELFTSDMSRRLVRLNTLRERLLQARPRLVNLKPLSYGSPDDDDEDVDEAVLTTAVIDLKGSGIGDLAREAKRRIVGASALPDGAASPRSVKPPPRPSSPGGRAIEVERDAGMKMIDNIGLPPPKPQPTPEPAPPPRPAEPQPEPEPEPEDDLDPISAPTRVSNPSAEPSPLADTALLPDPPPGLAAPPPEFPPLTQAAAEVDAPLFPEPEPEPAIIRDHSSSQAHIASIGPPQEESAIKPLTVLLGAACLLIGAVAAYFVMGQITENPPPATQPSGAPAETATVEPSSVPSVPSSTSSNATPDPPPIGDVNTCVASLFPANTFETGPPKLAKLCTTADPIRGSKDLRGEIVRAGGGASGVTDGMRLMSTMGWYRLAAFAIVRGRCCESAPPFKTPTALPCNVDNTLERLARDTAKGDELAAEAALEQVTKAFQCLGRGGGADFFGQQGLPSGGELTNFTTLFKSVLKKK